MIPMISNMYILQGLSPWAVGEVLGERAADDAAGGEFGRLRGGFRLCRFCRLSGLSWSWRRFAGALFRDDGRGILGRRDQAGYQLAEVLRDGQGTSGGFEGGPFFRGQAEGDDGGFLHGGNCNTRGVYYNGFRG